MPRNKHKHNKLNNKGNIEHVQRTNKIDFTDIITIINKPEFFSILNNYIFTNNINVAKRILDNYIMTQFEYINYESLYNIYYVITKYFDDDRIFKFTSANIIIDNFIKHNILIPSTTIYIDNTIEINIFETFIKAIQHNIKQNKKLQCNKKFISNMITYIYMNMKHDYLYNYSSRNKITYHKYLYILIPIIKSSNIYISNNNIDKLIFIIQYIKYIQDTDTSLYHKYNKSLNLLIQYTKQFILNDKQLKILNLGIHFNNKSYVAQDIITKNIKPIKSQFFGKSNIWCNKVFKNIKKLHKPLLDNGDNGDDIDENSIMIIDGRNTLYNSYDKSNSSKLDINKFYNILSNMEYIQQYFIFNEKHKKIILQMLNKYIYATYISNASYKIILKQSETITRYNNIVQVIIKNINTDTNIDTNNNIYKNINIIFTPKGVDDDLMSIYLKLTYPKAYLKTNDRYGKYMESIKSTNHYLYTLWNKLLCI